MGHQNIQDLLNESNLHVKVDQILGGGTHDGLPIKPTTTSKKICFNK